MITEASPILNLLLAKGVGTKTLSEIVDKLVAIGLSPDEVGINDLAEGLHWRDELKANALAVQDQADSLAEQLERQNVRILVRGFAPYPDKLTRVLGKNAPPVLFAKGNLSLLTAKAVGFCGSRHASHKGIHVAAESARQLGENGIDVVSGYAKGVDLAAHCAALEARGTTTIVLAEGILHFRPKREIKSLLSEENYLVLSEYSPRLPWAARNAMQRNSTIIGLSDAMIVIESGTTGGTHACAESALRLKHPLFVAEYAVPAESAGGNQQFLSQGAQALRGDRQGRPNLTRVYEALGMGAADETPAEDNGRAPEPSASRPELRADASHPPVKQQPTTQSSENLVDQRGYPKRLIEVDLPIARISAHARREKSIRHGHISTLHIWWARRPLAACRAVICAALWPDPADPLCPPAFRQAAIDALTAFARRVNPDKMTEEKRHLQATLSDESRGRWEALAAGTLTFDPAEPADMPILRMALLDFIADFANWDNSTVPAYLETSRALTQAAHEALGGEPGTRPLVVDPFAGGGSIPLEALRVGADAFASDLNPIPVLLNKVVLEYIPKYGKRLAEEVLKWGEWIKNEAEKELAEFYPKDPDGATPIAYLWARTIRCEGPACGAEVPLIRSLWLAKNANRSVAVQLVPNLQQRRIEIQIILKQQDGWVDQANPQSQISNPKFDGTVKRGSASCPCCGYTTPVARVREQLKPRFGGANDARLISVVRTFDTRQGRYFRLPTETDQRNREAAIRELAIREAAEGSDISLVPKETLPVMSGVFNAPIYGHSTWGSLYTARQLLMMTTFSRLVRTLRSQFPRDFDEGFKDAIQTCLAMAVDRQADHGCTGCTWNPSGPKLQHLFGRQAIPMNWDFAEANPFGDSVGDWLHAIECVDIALNNALHFASKGAVEQAGATAHPLPDDSVDALITDPPYYNAIPYADLSDFLYVWLRRTIAQIYPNLFRDELAPKEGEICEMAGWDPIRYPHKTAKWFEVEMAKAMNEGRRYLVPHGIGVVVFAHKTTDGWEAMLKAMIEAGWTVTASWPIDTEMATRLRAMTSAALASSVHLVCRPREDANGAEKVSVGEWRDILGELPKRIHEWMPRLAAEGVVGADAIFACLGPALEIFSRYSRVEKANGETATLREYLEHVWAAVSTEALSLIFKDANAAGLEPDARLTAMWLWTIGGGGTNGNGKKSAADESVEDEESAGDSDDEETPSAGKGKATGGFLLEYDAARKIAQGLGVHLEQCESLVEIKGDKARLLPVAERTTYLFGKGTEAGAAGKGRKKKPQQKTLFAELDEAEAADAGWTAIKGPPAGATVLDRVHQAMILFAANRGELLKRFLVEDGVGKDARFWKLADNLNKLYPPGTDERRWVEGVLARKKGLGL